MNKILLSISIPIINVDLELLLPNCKKIGFIKDKVLEILRKDYAMGSVNTFRLVNKFSGIEYDSNLVVAESNIRNGTKLILI